MTMFLRRQGLALLALLVALGGTSYAAATLAPRSVGTKQLKNGAVTFKKIQPATRDQLRGQTGPAGQPGAKGDQGIQGPPGNTGTTGNTGAAGTTGQDVTTVYGTGQLQVTGTTNYTLIPGLTQTVTVPANAKVVISTDGGAQNTAAGGTYSVVDVAFFVDGTISAAAGQRRVVMANTAQVGQILGSWGMTKSLVLSAGSHTIAVRVAGADVGMSTANVSSAAAPQLQGQLTVEILKQ